MKFQSYKLSKQQYQYDNWVNVQKKKNLETNMTNKVDRKSHTKFNK
jgi:hypothetical protein